MSCARAQLQVTGPKLCAQTGHDRRGHAHLSMAQGGRKGPGGLQACKLPSPGAATLLCMQRAAPPPTKPPPRMSKGSTVLAAPLAASCSACASILAIQHMYASQWVLHSKTGVKWPLIASPRLCSPCRDAYIMYVMLKHTLKCIPELLRGFRGPQRAQHPRNRRELAGQQWHSSCRAGCDPERQPTC